jgi:hypothetical protein
MKPPKRTPAECAHAWNQLMRELREDDERQPNATHKREQLAYKSALLTRMRRGVQYKFITREGE